MLVILLAGAAAGISRDPKQYAALAGAATRYAGGAGTSDLHDRRDTPHPPGGMRGLSADRAGRGRRRAGRHLGRELFEAIAALSTHSLRVELTQDLFAAGEDGAGIALTLRWSSPATALRYRRKLAVRSNAASRVLSKVRR